MTNIVCTAILKEQQIYGIKQRFYNKTKYKLAEWSENG